MEEFEKERDNPKTKLIQNLLEKERKVYKGLNVKELREKLKILDELIKDEN